MTEQNKPGVATGIFTNPIDKSHHPIVTSHYGTRIHPKHHVRRHHNGVDLGLRDGERPGVPHLATDGGTITYAGPAPKGNDAGNVVVIDHGNGVVSRYFHLDTVDPKLKVNGLVAKGQVIGTVGKTGSATARHVHWEVLRGTTKGIGNGLGSELKEKSVDPEPFLRNGNYSKITSQKTISTPLSNLQVHSKLDSTIHGYESVDEQASQEQIVIAQNGVQDDQDNSSKDLQVDAKGLNKRLFDLAYELSDGDESKLIKNLGAYGEIGKLAYAQNDSSVKDLPLAEQQQAVNNAFATAQNALG
jgi:hypothetical protein